MRQWAVYVRKALTGDLKVEFLEANNERDCRNAAMILVDGEIEAIKELEVTHTQSGDPTGLREIGGHTSYYPEPADFLTFGL